MSKTKKDPLPTKPQLSKQEMGERLKAIRLRRNLSQLELATYLSTTNSVISDYERGRLRLPGDVAVQLAHAMNVTTDELLGAEKLEDPSASLFRRFKEIEKLPQHQQKIILETLDTFMRGLEK